MSLRLRLLLAVGAVALTALAIADVVTYQELRSFLYSRIDQSLEQSHMPIEAALGSGSARWLPGGLVPVARVGDSRAPSGPGPGPARVHPPRHGTTENTSNGSTQPSCDGFSGLTADLLHDLQPGTFVEVRSASNTILCRSTQPGLRASSDSADPQAADAHHRVRVQRADFGEADGLLHADWNDAGSTGCGHRSSTAAPTRVDNS